MIQFLNFALKDVVMERNMSMNVMMETMLMEMDAVLLAKFKLDSNAEEALQTLRTLVLSTTQLQSPLSRQAKSDTQLRLSSMLNLITCHQNFSNLLTVTTDAPKSLTPPLSKEKPQRE